MIPEQEFIDSLTDTDISEDSNIFTKLYSRVDSELINSSNTTKFNLPIVSDNF